MSRRSWFGGLAIVAYVAVLAHVTSATTCPAREPGACAKVHALMHRRPASAARVLAIAEPMTTRSSDPLVQVALAHR